MARVKVTGDEASIFNALAIGLAIEILSGRLDHRASSKGYMRLVKEFAELYSDLNPVNFNELKKCLKQHNNPKDIELLLAPVLFLLYKKYYQQLDSKIELELANLLWTNLKNLEGIHYWEQLTHVSPDNHTLFSILDNLDIKEKNNLLNQLKMHISHFSGQQSLPEIQKCVKETFKELIDQIVQFFLNQTSYQKSLRCCDIQLLSDSLFLNLEEENYEIADRKKNKIKLYNQNRGWDVDCDDADIDLHLNGAIQPLVASNHVRSGQFTASDVLINGDALKLEAQPACVNNEIELSKIEIDNPGQGNCAFYAFSIGLIHLIQEESISGQKKIFNQWVNLDSSIVQYWDDILNFDYQSENKLLLDSLQSSLRFITHDVQIKELRYVCAHPGPDYVQVLSNSNFIKFAELYYSNQVDSRFNEFAKSNIIINDIKALKEKKLRQNEVDKELAQLFIRLIYGKQDSISEDTDPKYNSPIITGISSITKNSFWGTHYDLNHLAEVFEVNFHPLQNGVARSRFVDQEERHTITVNNKWNAHWTTYVTVASNASATQKQPKSLLPNTTSNDFTNLSLLS